MTVRPVRGLWVRHVKITACPCTFAIVWADVEPLEPDATADFEFVRERPGAELGGTEPLPDEYAEAFARGVRRAWEPEGGGRPVIAARLVMRDAESHPIDSHERDFTAAGLLLGAEVLRCLRTGDAPRPVGWGTVPDRAVPPMPHTRRR